MFCVARTGNTLSRPEWYFTRLCTRQPQVRQQKQHRSLVVPHGLLGALLNVTSSIDAAFVTTIGAPLVKALLPRPDGAYTWLPEHQDQLDTVVRCFASQLSVHRSLALEATLESAVLSPLEELYRRSLSEKGVQGGRLSSKYTNSQLFAILWTLGHCGAPDGRLLVNGVLKNWSNFGKAFRCYAHKAMPISERCNFWA